MRGNLIAISVHISLRMWCLIGHFSYILTKIYILCDPFFFFYLYCRYHIHLILFYHFLSIPVYFSMFRMFANFLFVYSISIWKCSFSISFPVVKWNFILFSIKFHNLYRFFPHSKKYTNGVIILFNIIFATLFLYFSTYSTIFARKFIFYLPYTLLALFGLFP